MSLVNFYETIKSKKSINPNFKSHGMEVPFRAIMAAPSGAGKSNGICNLILNMSKTFHEIIYVIKSSDEPLIDMLEKRIGVKIIEDEVPLLSEYEYTHPDTGKKKRKDDKQRLIIFDDFMGDKKNNARIADYYKRGRKVGGGFSMVYISQSYFQIPKVIRDNTQYFMLGRNLLNKDLKMILSVFGVEMTLNDFVHLYNELTSEPMSFIMINNIKKTIRPNIIGEVIQL